MNRLSTVFLALFIAACSLPYEVAQLVCADNNDGLVLSDGFAGPDSVKTSGMAVGPDGSLYVADSRIWRIVYTG